MRNETDVESLIGLNGAMGRRNSKAFPSDPQHGAAVLQRTLLDFRIPLISHCDEVCRRGIDKIVDGFCDSVSLLRLHLMNENTLHALRRLSGVQNALHVQCLLPVRGCCVPQSSKTGCNRPP